MLRELFVNDFRYVFQVDGAATVLGCAHNGCSDEELVYKQAVTFDSLLEELQTYKCTLPSSSSTFVSNSAAAAAVATRSRLHSFPTSESKPLVPERSSGSGDSVVKRVPPPPPPRTSSKSPLASPTNPCIPVSTSSGCTYSTDDSPARRNSSSAFFSSSCRTPVMATATATMTLSEHPSASSSSCESINSQEGAQHLQTCLRHEQLELRHQELLKKQKALQEQYCRLQHLRKNSSSPPDLLQLKKTGSENNILAKMGMGFGIAVSSAQTAADNISNFSSDRSAIENMTFQSRSSNEETKIYETDIL